MKLLNLFTVKSQVNNSRSGDYSRLKQAETESLHTISGGRSMVEMLGVLAIIGVLSVGAIAGYGTAMYKYRMNKTVQTVTDAMQNLVELSTKDWGREEIYGSSDMVKYDLLPASMCPEDYVDVIYGETGISCKLPLGQIKMDFLNESFFMGYFQITFYEGDIVKSCVDFLSHGWQNMYPQEWLRTYDDASGSFIEITGKNQKRLWSVIGNVWGEDVPKNITLSDIQNACNGCKGKEYCVINMWINHEI